jgi:hypothetical protein
MFIARCNLVSMSPYSQSKYIREKKTRDETHEDFEKRSWPERCHWTEDGHVFIPATCFKNALAEAAKYKSIQIPGKGKSTYTKHFEAGVMVLEGLELPVTRETLQHEWLHVPSDGRRGGTTRVEKCFPLFMHWEGEVEFLIFDEIITREVFEEHLSDAGKFIGIGRFRPRNNGTYGRFRVESLTWMKG